MSQSATPARDLLIQDAPNARRAQIFAWLQWTLGFGLLIAIGLGRLSANWGWLGLALVGHAVASRLHDMLWRIWLETVPPEELEIRRKMIP